MIICSKHEGNGTYREFKLDDAAPGEEVHVKTHLAHQAEDRTVAEDDWTDAGIITRAPDGLEAAVLRPVRRDKFGRTSFVKLDKLFSNEIAALQAIAVHYEPSVQASN